jgi:hypothetical protein
MDISPQEALAIERFAMSSTLPILLDREDKAVLHATGTLFAIAGRHLVITARHIFDDPVDPKKLAHPSAPLGGTLHTFGEYDLTKPDADWPDIAVMSLRNPETIARLGASWRFLSLANIAMPSIGASNGAFFLAGYPAALTRPMGELVAGKFVTVYTQRLPSVPPEAKKPVDPDIDLFFDYAQHATSLDGKEVSTPELPGASGASVWEYRKGLSAVWHPEDSLAVVGVQSAYIHSKYFRATNWLAVAKVLEQLGQDLAESVRHRISEI